MAVYYIDPLRGSERGDGLSPKAPKKQKHRSCWKITSMNPMKII